MNMFGKITATASYVPEKIVTNDDLSNLMDTSDEWIHSRTGIKKEESLLAKTLLTFVFASLKRSCKMLSFQQKVWILSW